MFTSKKAIAMIYPILLGIGCIVFAASLFLIQNNIRFIKRGTKTTATVIDLQQESSSNSDREFTPIFKFTTATGEAVSFKGFGASNPPAYNIGEKVSIVYDHEKPEDAKVLSYFGTFGAAIILMALSMPMIIIGGGYYIAQLFLKQ
jgi:ribosomal protein S16